MAVRAAIPVPHLRAEVAAYPLSSEVSLRAAVTTLDAAPRKNSPGALLWRGAETELLARFPGMSVDNLVALRDKVWFSELHDGASVDLAQYLRGLARYYLRGNGAYAEPNTESAKRELSSGLPPAPAAAWHWRWLSFALPPDLVLAALWDDGCEPSKVARLTPGLDRILRDRGFAETHLHRGAGMDFSLLWVAAMLRIADGCNPPMPELFESHGAAFDEGRELLSCLLRAGIVRVVLAAFLRGLSARPGRSRTFEHFLGEQILQTRSISALDWLDIGRVVQQVASDGGLSACRAVTHQAGTGCAERRLVEITRLRSLYRALIGSSDARPGTVDEVFRCDPALMGASYRDGLPTAELALTARGLAYLVPKAAQPVADALFSRLFWQYVRIRSLVYRHITQRPLTPGLQWFIRFYGRVGELRRSLNEGIMVESSARLSGLGQGLRSLEVRTSPSDTVNGMLSDFRAGLSGWRRAVATRGASDTNSSLEFGYVLHFDKFREGDRPSGLHQAYSRGTQAEPRPSLGVASSRQGFLGYRYGEWFSRRWHQACALADLLQRFPLTLYVVRGVDSCTDELGIPTWVLVPLYQCVRSAGRSASAWLRRTLGLSVRPLFASAHAGEDFVHLRGGLRRVDEALTVLACEDGDRLGHAVALGVDPHWWARRTGRVLVSREEQLFDLAWEWRCYVERQLEPRAGRLGWVKAEIQRLGRGVFGSPVGPNDVCEVLEILQAPLLLRYLLGFPGPRDASARAMERRASSWRTAVRLAYRHLVDEDVFRRGQELEWVEAESEADILADLQLTLLRKVSRRAVTVEVNPSSNLLVGDQGDLQQHQFWRLAPPTTDGDRPPVRVCVGSDDPITFATTLPAEFQLLWDALVGAGLGDQDAETWIDLARRNGLAGRFTIPMPADLDPTAVWRL